MAGPVARAAGPVAVLARPMPGRVILGPASHVMPKTAWYLADMAEAQCWQCQSCGYEFNPLKGDAEGDVEPVAGFDDLPAGWSCPICDGEKDGFVLLRDAGV